MIMLNVFHSGNPAWKSCQTAIGVARQMKEDFEEAVEVNIYTNDAPEAMAFEIKSSTNVFVDGERVPLDVALSNEKMNAYLKERM